jgi:hypothetical protein
MNKFFSSILTGVSGVNFTSIRSDLQEQIRQPSREAAVV